MIIVSLSDIHGDVSRLPDAASDLAGADVVLVSGDLTQFGGWEEAKAIVAAIRPHAKRLFAVPGNCDRTGVEQFLDSEGLNLHGRVEDLGEVALMGAGYSLPCPGTTPGEIEEDEFERVLRRDIDSLPEGRALVLLTHQPPVRTAADLSHSGRRAGSEEVRRFIEKFEPLACFCGHIHEARSADDLCGTKILNPGPAARGHLAYARIEDGKLVEAGIRPFGG